MIMKHFKLYIILSVIGIAAFLLIINKFLLYGILLLGFAVFIYWIWLLFIKSKDTRIIELRSSLDEKNRKLNALETENDELRNRKLNISEIKNILDLGLMEVKTNFTRTWNEKFNHNEKSVHFIGALQIDVTAKYGIDLKEMRIKFNQEKNEIIVANVNPRFLSFNDLDYKWKIAEILEYKEPFFGTDHWRKSDSLQGLMRKITEDYRQRTHQEVKNGPAEIEWVINPLKKQIKGALELMLGSHNRTIKIVDTFDDSFKALSEYNENEDL